MARQRIIVFLSATGRDLSAHRRAIIEHMRALDAFICDAMEEFGARDAEAVAFCRQRVLESDVLVCIIGRWRGWEPASDGHNRSITELEYTWAGEAKKSRLMYITPEDMALADDLVMTPDQQARQRSFRDRVRREQVHDQRFYMGELRTPADLAAAVMVALANVLFRQQLKERSKAPAAPGQPLSDEAEPRVALEADPAGALARFATDADFQDLMRNPDHFDVTELAAAVLARADQRATEGRADEARGAAKLKQAAADYQRLADIVGCYDVSRRQQLYAKAVDADPSDGAALFRFAQFSLETGRLQEAVHAFQRFAQIPIDTLPPLGAAQGYTGYGDLLAALGRRDQAMTAYDNARAIAARTPDAGNAELRFALGIANERIGNIFMDMHEFDEALKYYEARRSIVADLAAGDPFTTRWNRDLSVAHNKVGTVLVAQAHPLEALTAFEAGLDLVKSLAAEDPRDAGLQRDLSCSYNHIADVFRASGQLDEASNNYNAALEIAEGLVKVDPGNARWQRDLALCNERIGNVQFFQEKHGEARAAFERAIGIYEVLATLNPEDLKARIGSVVPRMQLSVLDRENATQHLRAALDILKPLAAEQRLDALRLGWIPLIEGQLSKTEKG